MKTPRTKRKPSPKYNDVLRSNRWIKTTVIICLLLLIVAIIDLYNKSPATGYESSIYTAIPPLLWIALLISIVFGLAIIVQQIYTQRHESSNTWALGLLLLLCSYIVLLSLWIIRGYTVWGPGDPLSHLGTIQEVISNGHIDAQNFYPITHIYLAQICQICDLSPILIQKHIPLLFALMSVVFTYLLAKAMLPNSKGATILIAAISIAPIHGWYLNLTPNHLSNLAFPLFLFILVRAFSPGTLPWKLLFVITILLLPSFHPIPTLAMIAVLAAIWWLPDWTQRHFSKKPREDILPKFSFNTTIIMLLVVWSILWISLFPIWYTTIGQVQSLAGGTGQTHLSALAEDISYTEGHGYSVGLLFLKKYGAVVLYVILALTALPLLWPRKVPRKVRDQELKKFNKENVSKLNYQGLISLYGPLLIFLLVIGLLYTLNIIFGPLRLLVYIVTICTVLTGFTLYHVLERTQRYRPNNYTHKLFPALVVLLLVVVFVSSAIKLYPSRYTLTPNMQVTDSEIDGMDWFLHGKNAHVPIAGLGFSAPERFADLLLTPDERNRRRDLHRSISRKAQPPIHFGYDENTNLGESYTEDTFLMLSEKDRLVYQQIFPEIAEIRFLPSDFHNLEQDFSVDALYSNGGFKVYFIHELYEPSAIA